MGLAAWHNILVEVNLHPPHGAASVPFSQPTPRPSRADRPRTRTRLADSFVTGKTVARVGKVERTEW